MGTTTRYQLPWPDPTAPVRAGAANIRSLAEAVDAAHLSALEMNNGVTVQPLTSGNHTLIGVNATVVQIGNGFTPYGSNRGIKAVRAMSRVLVNARCRFGGNSTGRRIVEIATGDLTAPVVLTSDARPPAVALSMPVSVSFIISVAAGDGIGLLMFQDCGTALNADQCSLAVSEL